MVSGGFRIGAWDYLKFKHITPLTGKEGEIIPAKMVIYAGEPEEYYCFITVEAKDNEYIIRARLQEKESEIQIMKGQIAMLTESHKDILQCLKYPQRLTQILNEK